MDKESVMIDIILNLSDGSDWICEELHSIESEMKYCEENCNNLCEECVRRLVYKRLMEDKHD